MIFQMVVVLTSKLKIFTVSMLNIQAVVMLSMPVISGVMLLYQVMIQFDLWFRESVTAGAPEPHAMTLATVNPDDTPSARVVLLKDYGPQGFTFFTNYESKKGLSLLGYNRDRLCPYSR